MKTCNRYQDLFSEYIEGELNHDRKKDVETHLQSCSPCAQKLSNINGLRQLLIALPRKKVSSDFDSLLHARIRLENRNRRSVVSRLVTAEQFRLPAYALSFALILIATVLIVSQLTMSRRHLPGAGSNMAIVESTDTEPASGLVTIYPLDRTSVNRFLETTDSGIRQGVDVSSIGTDTVHVYQGRVSANHSNARVFQTSY